MKLNTRLGRVERVVLARATTADELPMVYLRLPINGQENRPPGEYWSGPNVVMVLYDPALDGPYVPGEV